MNFLLIINTDHGAPAARQQLPAWHGPSWVVRISCGPSIFRVMVSTTLWSGAVTDAGTQDLHRFWKNAAQQHGIDLLLCSAAYARRFPDTAQQAVSAPYRQAGLAELLSAMSQCHRVVSF